jgi:hypothetical protein
MSEELKTALELVDRWQGESVMGLPAEQALTACIILGREVRAKDAELARLRGVVEAARKTLDLVVKYFEDIPPSEWRVPTGLWDEAEQARDALAALPSPAEAGEKVTPAAPLVRCWACGRDAEKCAIGSAGCCCSDCDHCPRPSYTTPAAPSDAKARE